MAETKKYARIKKAAVDGVWYADKIGQIFEVVRENSVAILTKCGGHHSVLREDAEIIVTENRRPKVGERVLITYGITSSGDYKTGDICTVRSVVDIYGTITVKEYGNYVIAREYEVIVNNEVKNEEADGMEIDLNAMGDRELYAHGEAVMEAIKKRMFQAGFRAAKQAQRKLAKMNAEKSAQARRDEIVEQAKADVERLKENNIRLRTFNISLEVNRKDRSVEAIAKRPKSNRAFYGIAKAAPSDCFNVHIGKAIALRRALGLTVPDEYLNAPQPTEVRVGDVIRHRTLNYTNVVDDVESGEMRYTDGEYDFIDAVEKGRINIIDDSREEVGS
ncbi:hypothetical protein [Bacillus velezensis]|nr:hypothetical protein [Bacillus velezensis]MCV4329284.1 hypothetical protein [Bacillus velezensis]URD65196.1 hypothetical protein M8X21_04575 [Bacillus velezensis]WED89403.1 hypothetical protein PXG99_10060 [Bacillus velezensis]WFB52420.1 hypothetical protein P0M29_17600 [Bacillus velezensis]